MWARAAGTGAGRVRAAGAGAGSRHGRGQRVRTRKRIASAGPIKREEITGCAGSLEGRTSRAGGIRRSDADPWMSLGREKSAQGSRLSR